MGTLPQKFAVYPQLLEESGYFVGFTGKGWAPGNFRAAVVHGILPGRCSTIARLALWQAHRLQSNATASALLFLGRMAVLSVGPA